MTATRPPHQTLTGEFVRLEPLTREHLPALYAAIGHPQVFAGGYGGGPVGLRPTLADFTVWAGQYFDWVAGNPYVIVLLGGEHQGKLVGTSTLSDFELANEVAHLGWTAYDPRVWGTAVNVETKLLLFGLAFENGFGRVRLQADCRNERSRAAISGLGATFEGMQRRDKVRADGSFRDTAVFSVIIDDWPNVSALLRARLDAFAGQPVTFRPSPR
ncbi:MAG: GNAT family N-acetyltransferase [Microbacteriaceae bacterium]|nr:GNAT family N-acetyltransferase [Microbacteriaceae bacterium]